MQTTKHSKIFLVILLVLVIGGSIAHYLKATEKYETAAYSDSFERGKNLVFNICGQCHYNETTRRFTGNLMNDLPSFMGKVYSANLTHSPSGAFAQYKDNEVTNLLKTGIARDGRYVPYMIRPNLADEDISDMLVYFHSNDSAVIETDKVAGITKLNVFGKTAMKIAGKPLPYKKGVLKPNENDSVIYGRYLIDNLACYHCHSKSILGLEYMEPENSKGYMQGGMKFKTSQGKKIYASNLTFDKETGIGNYTKEDFRRAVINGIRPKGDSLHLPMQRFNHLTNKQSDAIYVYLKSLKTVKKKTKN